MVHQVVGEATGRNRVDLMIIDGGFLPLDDYPDAEIIPGWKLLPLPTPLGSCSGGRDCPWHGTTVASAALGRFNDGIGAAGPAGPAVLDGDSGDETSFVNPIFVQSPLGSTSGTFSSSSFSGFRTPSVAFLTSRTSRPRATCRRARASSARAICSTSSVVRSRERAFSCLLRPAMTLPTSTRNGVEPPA